MHIIDTVSNEAHSHLECCVLDQHIQYAEEPCPTSCLKAIGYSLRPITLRILLAITVQGIYAISKQQIWHRCMCHHVLLSLPSMTMRNEVLCGDRASPCQ